MIMDLRTTISFLIFSFLNTSLIHLFWHDEIRQKCCTLFFVRLVKLSAEKIFLKVIHKYKKTSIINLPGHRLQKKKESLICEGVFWGVFSSRGTWLKGKIPEILQDITLHSSLSVLFSSNKSQPFNTFNHLRPETGTGPCYSNLRGILIPKVGQSWYLNT